MSKANNGKKLTFVKTVAISDVNVTMISKDVQTRIIENSGLEEFSFAQVSIYETEQW